MFVGPLFILGLLVGSFLNVLIYRIPRGQAFMLGRSRCTHCNHDLVWYDLIPLFSYVMLRGRCRYCHAHISPQYPIIELISGLFFVFGSSIVVVIFLELFLVISVIDYQHFIIPDSLLIVAGIVGIVDGVSRADVVSALVAGSFFFLLWLVSRGRWIGFGDVKLAGVLGLLFGFPGTLVIIYGAVVVGGLLGIILLLLKKATMKTALPFGTLLCICAGTYIFLQGPILKALASWNFW